eukprot:s1349_g16.t1
MLLRLPPGLSQRQLFQYMAHIVKAQEGNDVQIFAGTGSALEAAEIKSLVGESEAAQRLVVVSGRGDSAKPGEAVLAQNAACALAEAARDSGKHAAAQEGSPPPNAANILGFAFHCLTYLLQSFFV